MCERSTNRNYDYRGLPAEKGRARDGGPRRRESTEGPWSLRRKDLILSRNMGDCDEESHPEVVGRMTSLVFGLQKEKKWRIFTM